MPATDPEDALIASQLKHTMDLIRFDLDKIKTTIEHNSKTDELRLDRIETLIGDHETRIRCIHKDVTKNNVVYGVTSLGSTLLSSIALLRTFFIM
jgi:hypothetical protein